MFLSPHADDVELGCGGYVARLVEEGRKVVVVLMGVRDTSMLHWGSTEVTAEQRAAEFVASMEVLGVEKHPLLYFNHPADLCQKDRTEVITTLDSLLAEFEVTSLFLPVPSFHQEHRFTYECGMAAARPTRYGTRLKHVLVYEGPSSSWGTAPSAGGAMYADITPYLEKKLESLREYRSQMYREDLSLISFDAVQTLARWRGLECGAHYAERFLLLRGLL